MSIIKCKMCGGTLEINNNESIATCEYCGTQQTLPRLNDERKANLYDRANHFRRNNEFDKAMGIYEQILNDDRTDAEAYWSLVLCRYGIEYVEDPATHRRVPTVNRAQFTSIFDDDNYKSALQYADGYQRSLYEEEAKAINEIQKGILAISQKEEPFDVFICYKETDQHGRRTHDSVLANDLYHQLTQEGFKVFFARITLEDKLGSAYEPYIFAALNSAKVMVVLGTRPEFFTAVWVKNEWSRYLSLIKSGAKKVLIPAYKDMDPYDLPDEFSHLQAQDMSKLGFMQDLIRGIKKLASANEQPQTVIHETVVANANTNAAPLLKRAFMFLEDGDWSSADEYCEKVLDIDPETAEAYVGKLMAELHVTKQPALADCKEPFDDNSYYQKALRFANAKLKAELQGYIEHINLRNENARLEGIYHQASTLMCKAKTENQYKSAANLFSQIPDYKNSVIQKDTCLEKAEISRKDALYTSAIAQMKGGSRNYENAIQTFKQIPGWKEADALISECENKIKELKEQAETEYKEAAAREKRKQNRNILLAVIAIIVCFVLVVYFGKVVPNKKKASIEAQLKTATVGSYITFGAYEQDNDKLNGKEGIEWLVLAKENNRLFVISRYALANQPFHTSYTNPTWETCTLRKWLNHDFFNAAFGIAERSMIQTVTVTEGSPYNATKDNIFLLSVAEAKKYLVSIDSRQCEATAFAKKQGVNRYSYCDWRLRTNGNEENEIAYINEKGAINYSHIYNDYSYGVRPALWISLPQ